MMGLKEPKCIFELSEVFWRSQNVHLKIALFARTLAAEGRDAGQVEQFAREYGRGTWGVCGAKTGKGAGGQALSQYTVDIFENIKDEIPSNKSCR